jgi:hypothetical protein
MRKLIFLLLIFMLLVSCGKQENGTSRGESRSLKDRKKPLAWGQRQKIYVFADDQVWRYAEDELRKTLERTFYTTVNEKMFVLERIDFNKLEDYFRFNNIIFYCDASSKADVSSYVRERLGQKLDDEVGKSGGAIFPAYNLWADDQLVLFLVGEDEETLLRLNIYQSNEVWEIFRNRLLKRLEYQLYRNNIKPYTNYKDQAWQIDLPMNFLVFRQDEANNFISYISRSKSMPDRYIFIYHEKMGSEELNRKWLIEKRNELAAMYYEGDKFTEEDVMSSKCQIAGYDCIKLMGRWQNDKYAIGGSFSCFAFQIPELDKIFIIDNSVYYPEGDKLPSLLELEIISNSFKLK